MSIITMNSIFLNSLIAKAKNSIPPANAVLISTGNLFNWSHSPNFLVILMNFNRKLVVLASI